MFSEEPKGGTSSSSSSSSSSTTTTSPSKAGKVVIREVWAGNLESEMEIISNIIDDYPFISMDTEFPGVIYKHKHKHRHSHRHGGRDHPEDLYQLLKSNVDELNLIQVGLTLSDASGNLPDLGTHHHCYYIWEFNFSDFDIRRHPHAIDSVDLLRQQGVDFDRNTKEGVDSSNFAELIMSSGLLCNHSITWVTFHSAYDFAYLIKILTRCPLPDSLQDFLALTRVFFGYRVYDIKYMMKFCKSLYGGLDRVAKTLQLNRTVGKCHQAGSDSLLTCLTFQKMIQLYFVNNVPEYHAGVIFGLEVF